MTEKWAINGHRVVKRIPFFAPPELLVTDPAGTQTARWCSVGSGECAKRSHVEHQVLVIIQERDGTVLSIKRSG